METMNLVVTCWSLSRLHGRYHELAPHLVPMDYTNEPDVKVPLSLIVNMPELKVMLLLTPQHTVNTQVLVVQTFVQWSRLNLRFDMKSNRHLILWCETGSQWNHWFFVLNILNSMWKEGEFAPLSLLKLTLYEIMLYQDIKFALLDFHGCKQAYCVLNLERENLVQSFFICKCCE